MPSQVPRLTSQITEVSNFLYITDAEQDILQALTGAQLPDIYYCATAITSTPVIGSPTAPFILQDAFDVGAQVLVLLPSVTPHVLDFGIAETELWMVGFGSLRSQVVLSGGGVAGNTVRCNGPGMVDVSIEGDGVAGTAPQVPGEPGFNYNIHDAQISTLQARGGAGGDGSGGEPAGNGGDGGTVGLYRCVLTATPQVGGGSEGADGGGGPGASGAAGVVNGGPRWNAAGIMSFFNTDTQKFHSLTIVGAAGAETTQIGAATV